VVIDDLNRIGITVSPHETYAPLIIDPDTMLSLPRAFQRLKPVGWWNPEVLQKMRIVQHSEFSARDRLDVGRQFSGYSSFPDLSGFLVLKMPDHGATITFGDI
jgi:hypothetical protein